MIDDEPWTSLVIAEGEATHHGKTPGGDLTLCGEVEVTAETLYRAPFYGTQDGDCPICAERVRDNHY